MTQDLEAFAKERGIKYFLFNFTDLFGTQRAKLVPAEAASKMQKTGAGFAAWLDFTPAHPDMFVRPDPASAIQHLTGNGCHVHVSVWDNTGKTNRFADDSGELGLSAEAYHFIGGLLDHGEALAAITNPTVNSYKRINAAPTLSGATWSPSSITFGGNNRTHMIRIPDDGRIELRLPDGAANPYLLMAVILAAGLDGVNRKTPSGDRLDIDMYTEGHKVKDAKQLPQNLLDALRNFEADASLQSALGDEFSAAYTKLRYQEWNKFACSLSQWERDNTLDC